MRTGVRTAKGVTGLDLTGLFVGSEGQLGVVTEAVLRLAPPSDPPLTALATFGSLDAVANALVRLRAERNGPNLIEVMDQTSLQALQAMEDFGFPEDVEAVLLVQSDRPGHANEDVTRYAALLEEVGAEDVAVADDAQEADALMAGRRALAPALELKGPHFIEDVCVPVMRLGDLIAEARRICGERDVPIVLSGHGGDGNLHPCLFFTDEASRERAEEAFGQIVETALAMGGTITGEHGVGTLKRRWLPQELGDAEMKRQQQIKALFDPMGVMNPGRPY